MTDRTFSIGPATPADIDGILAVQEENQPEFGGSLSARLSRQWFEGAVAQNFIIVARAGGEIAGYVAFTSIAAQAHIPIVQAMLAAFPAPDAYVHGPICVAAAYRGRGLASAMFRAEREAMQHSEAVSFIRHDNAASRRAHTGMGLHEVAIFEHNGVRYVVASSRRAQG